MTKDIVDKEIESAIVDIVIVGVFLAQRDREQETE
ncbi:hypothetical protein ES702_04544 [subsurface metagenome]